MKINKYFLNFFILLIGVIIVSPLFFSTSVQAEVIAERQTYHLTPTFHSFDSISDKRLDIDMQISTTHTYIYDMTLYGYINNGSSRYDKVWHVFYKYGGKNYDKWVVPSIHLAANTGTLELRVSFPIPDSKTISGQHNANLDQFDVYDIKSYDVNLYSDQIINNFEPVKFNNIPLNPKGTTTDFNSYSDFQVKWYSVGTVFNLGGNFYPNRNNIQPIIFKLSIPSTFYKIHKDEIKVYLRSWYGPTLDRRWYVDLWQPIETNTSTGAEFYFISPPAEEDQLLNLTDLCVEYTKDVYYSGNQTYKLSYLSPDQEDYFNVLQTYYLYQMVNPVDQETGNLDNKNDLFSSASDQMIQLEDQLQGDFNSAIGNITVPENPFGNMGNMFGNSSRFLVHMFNEFTLNHGSPFGSVITFSLLLGLAMLMIGKKGNR